MRSPPSKTPSSSPRGMMGTLRQDLAAWERHGWPVSESNRKSILLLLVSSPGLRATLLHRLAHSARERGIPALPIVLAQLNTALHGIEIQPSLPVGPGLYLPHTVGSVIHAESIGANVTLQGGITIGLRTDAGFPVIGDNVTIAAGARVLGRIVVGDGAVIGANAVVVKDVPAGATMIGIPARPLTTMNDT